jgi:GNAT superfamily N-acetyltransferase
MATIFDKDGFAVRAILPRPERRGLSRTWSEPDALELAVSVVPAHRRQGLGRSLADAAVAVARALGYRRLHVATQAANAPMCALIRRLNGKTVRDGAELYTTVQLRPTAAHRTST